MAKNVYAVTYKLELIQLKDKKVVRRNHGGEFVEPVIASSPEVAVGFVRSKHTSESQRVIRCGAQLRLEYIDLIPTAPEEEPAKVVPIASAPATPEPQPPSAA